MISIEEINKALGPEPLYQPIELLPDREVVQPCAERWEIIESYLGKTGLVMDLGCHTGWFCRRFAERGWKVIGVDKSKEWIDVARTVTFKLGLEVSYLEWDIKILTLTEADVILCLSTMMYLFEDHSDGWRIMRMFCRASPVLFFDIGGMYAKNLPLNLIQDFCDNSGYTKLEKIGVSDFEDRPMYMATR